MSVQEVKDKIRELGISPKRSLGQNFLVNPRSIAQILNAARAMPHAQLIEVGPGLGALTLGLKELGAPLTLIELDHKFSAHWRDQGYRVEECDALRWAWSNLPRDQRVLLVSNLPYQISSSLLIEISQKGPAIQGMILMFQKEVAQRIMSSLGGKEYGLLSVIAQLAWDIELLFEAGPRDFYPVPKIASRVLVFRRQPGEAMPVDEGLLSFVKAGFSQRRKFVVKNWARQKGWSKEGLGAALDIFTQMGYTEKARAEEINPEDFLQLYRKLKKGSLWG